MKVKEIRLEVVEIYNNDDLIFDGDIKNASDEILNSDVKSIYFDTSKLIIKI